MGPADAAAPLLEGKEEEAAPQRPGIDMSAHVGLRGLLAAHGRAGCAEGERAGGGGVEAGAGRVVLELEGVEGPPHNSSGPERIVLQHDVFIPVHF